MDLTCASSKDLSNAVGLLKRLAQEMSAKAQELRTMLAEIYDWFTEGFDTADLKDAKALLYELGA